MQNSKPSKQLENLIALGAFEAERRDQRTNLLDRLFLIMLGQKGSHAVRILRAHLKDWELYQIKLRIEREVDRTGASAPEQSREEFFTDLIAGLNEIAAIRTGARHASQSDTTAAPEIANLFDNATPENPETPTTPELPKVSPDTGDLLLYVIAATDSIAGRLLAMYHIQADDVSRDLSNLPAEELLLSEIRVIRRREGNPAAIGDSAEQPTNEEAPARPTAKKSPASMLARYGTDLTLAASEGRIDPVVGREREIERMTQILGRRKKNNPILVGEAGVGKSAIVEGLALRISSGDVPATVRGKRLFSLDMASLVAGTKFRGEFEERIKSLVDELVERRDAIIFIDEVHTIVGAGSTQGSLDVANILKPALARGEVQCIGATTLDEYRENIEKDAALERRFQKIIVEPASREQALEILRSIAPHYERHHSVTYTDEALAACVELTDRYITDRHLPDKAIDAMDEAASGVHKEDPNIPVEITATHIEQIITTMTGIPVERVSEGESSRLVRLGEHLSGQVIGQQAAVQKVSRSIIRSRSGLKDPAKPIGVFLFVGPTGVGKTLLAKELSKWMFDRPEALVRIDMSEYSEKHNVSRLIGSPPGYVGYGEGGQLTEAVRRQPYAVVLLDEIEKAHPDIFNVMLQMFDDGHLTDGLGRRVDFRNTIIIMTSNVGTRALALRGPSVGYATSATASRATASREAEYRGALEQTFAPEFINRIDDIVIFNTLESDDVVRVVDLELGALASRAAKLGYALEFTEAARRELATRGYEPDYGVRSLKRTILDTIEEPLAQMIVSGELSDGDTISIDDELQLTIKS
ncbi:MAG: ATP-dependent Clp protease ATP-binding subunit [Alistipes sp.]|jgi:ATP-dependent Clp protease ATP-binding subunit ClpC|nr:ATP-dependent Clp protease ATP-binding subunit [Alistipes sp.]